LLEQRFTDGNEHIGKFFEIREKSPEFFLAVSRTPTTDDWQMILLEHTCSLGEPNC